MGRIWCDVETSTNNFCFQEEWVWPIRLEGGERKGSTPFISLREERGIWARAVKIDEISSRILRKIGGRSPGYLTD